jgi:hypothetical protein
MAQPRFSLPPSAFPTRTGVGAQSSFKAIPLACLAGLVVGLAVGFLIYYGGHSIKDLKIFFIISTVMLFFIAAGQVRFVTQHGIISSYRLVAYQVIATVMLFFSLQPGRCGGSRACYAFFPLFPPA